MCVVGVPWLAACARQLLPSPFVFLSLSITVLLLLYVVSCVVFCARFFLWTFFCQDCLDLIEGKQKGLLTMLDDECRMGIRGTDENYASRLYKEHEGNPRFEADKALRVKLCFAVKHYAGQVRGCRQTQLE